MKALAWRPRLAYFWDRLRTSENITGILLAVLIGVGAGFGAVAFWKAIEGVSWLFFAQGWVTLGRFLGKYYVIILPCLGGLLFGPLVYFVAREAKGEGPPEVMEAVAVSGGRIRARVAPIKVLASAICIGSGGSVGREGPIVQIGASIGSALGQYFKLPEDWIRTAALCGAAGGISATFNAPIAGAFFALEVIQRRILRANAGYIILSSVAADVIARIFLFTPEHPTSFVIPPYRLTSLWETLLAAALGIIAAFLALGFIRFFYRTEDLFSSWRIPEYLKPAAGGLIVGLVGFFYPDLFGVGYGRHYGLGGIFFESGAVDRALAGQIGLLTALALFLLKMVATSVTLGSGGSGGIFAPTLFMGAMLGELFGRLVYPLFPGIAPAPGACALIGMGAFFATAVRGPITAMIILFEMTHSYELMLPLITAVVFSYLIGRAFTRDSIYTLRLKRRGIELRAIEERDIMGTIRVGEVMTRDFPTVSPEMTCRELITLLEETGHHGFPVVDKEGHLRGVVSLTNVRAAMGKQNCDLDQTRVMEFANKAPVVAYPDQTVKELLQRIGIRGFESMPEARIPVVDRKNPHRLLGVIGRHEIVRAYIAASAKQASEEQL